MCQLKTKFSWIHTITLRTTCNGLHLMQFLFSGHMPPPPFPVQYNYYRCYCHHLSSVSYYMLKYCQINEPTSLHHWDWMHRLTLLIISYLSYRAISAVFSCLWFHKILLVNTYMESLSELLTTKMRARIRRQNVTKVHLFTVPLRKAI